MAGWETSSSIIFTSNGEKLFVELSRGAARLEGQLKSLRDQMAGLDEVVATLTESSRFASAGLEGLDNAFRVSTASAREASASYARVAESARTMTAAIAQSADANRAASQVAAHPSFGRGGVMGQAAHYATVGAEFGVGLGIDSLFEAGKLQTILQTTKNILNLSQAQVKQVSDASFAVGHKYGMSVDQTADMFRELSRQSAGSMSFPDMLTMLPKMAQMQEVLGASRGFTPKQTVDATMSLTHLFREYDPKGQGPMFDTLLRMSEYMPTNLPQAVTQMKSFVPLLKSLGTPDVDAAALMVALSRFGLGSGRGGTNVRQLVLQSMGGLQLTSHAEGYKRQFLQKYDFIDKLGRSEFMKIGPGGKTDYDIFGFLAHIADVAKKIGPMATPQMYSVFGAQGGTISSLMADPVLVAQLHNIETALEKQKSLGLQAQSDSLNDTFGQVNKQTWNDFQSALTSIGNQALPTATKALKDLDATFMSVTDYFNTHNDLADFVSKHSYDFHMLGDDARTAMHAVQGLGTIVGGLGGAAFSAYGSLHRLADQLNKINPFKPPEVHDYGTLDDQRRKLWHSQYGKPRGGFAPIGSGGTGDGNPLHAALNAFARILPFGLDPDLYDDSPRAAPQASSSRREKTREVHHHHHNSVTVAVSGTHDPHAVARAVKTALRDMSRHPLSTMAASAATTRTHAHIPGPLSVNIP